jgi:hypothetical protein
MSIYVFLTHVCKFCNRKLYSFHTMKKILSCFELHIYSLDVDQCFDSGIFQDMRENISFVILKRCAVLRVFCL